MSRKVFWCAERMLLRFAPYMMFSRAGKTRTHIGGRHSPGINLLHRVERVSKIIHDERSHPTASPAPFGNTGNCEGGEDVPAGVKKAEPSDHR